MGIDDRVCKTEIFKAITGRERCGGGYQVVVPYFEIKPEDVDRVYLLSKKMQRCYHDDPESPGAKYFAVSFSKIEDAYLSADERAFKEAVRSLIVDIAFMVIYPHNDNE